mmetsp:Transcript_11253/g.25025  ORF Transcript_11253/g.25025 Transcript_11253/m.25025 type:complete len:273 (-) Transcript_11253:921-1739(-)
MRPAPILAGQCADPHRPRLAPRRAAPELEGHVPRLLGRKRNHPKQPWPQPSLRTPGPQRVRKEVDVDGVGSGDVSSLLRRIGAELKSAAATGCGEFVRPRLRPRLRPLRACLGCACHWRPQGVCMGHANLLVLRHRVQLQDRLLQGRRARDEAGEDCAPLPQIMVLLGRDGGDVGLVEHALHVDWGRRLTQQRHKREALPLAEGGSSASNPRRVAHGPLYGAPRAYRGPYELGCLQHAGAGPAAPLRHPLGKPCDMLRLVGDGALGVQRYER